MKHKIKSGTRIASPVSRIFYRLFGRSNPRSWADYHIVPERRGTLWVHSHGKNANLEFTGVPAELREQAVQLMFCLVAQIRGGHRFAADEDFSLALSSPRQGFQQTGTVRASGWKDKAHAGMLRIVDRGELLNAGFPKRLFASHLAARAQRANDPDKKTSLCRQSLKVFEGDVVDPGSLASIDIADLQNRCNIMGYTGLADALCEKGRYSEACAAIVPAIARSVDWAEAYRQDLLESGVPENPYTRFWQDANFMDIAARNRPATGSSQPASAAGGGFGGRRKDSYQDLLGRG